ARRGRRTTERGAADEAHDGCVRAGPATARPAVAGAGRRTRTDERPGRSGWVSTSRGGERLRLMAVHAHPDDETSKGAASMAMYAAQGVDVLVVTCTGGERGSILNPHFTGTADTMEEMTALRRAEMAAAAEVL